MEKYTWFKLYMKTTDIRKKTKKKYSKIQIMISLVKQESSFLCFSVLVFATFFFRILDPHLNCFYLEKNVLC